MYYIQKCFALTRELFSSQLATTVARNVFDLWVQFLCYRNPETKYTYHRTDPGELNRPGYSYPPAREKKLSVPMTGSRLKFRAFVATSILVALGLKHGSAAIEMESVVPALG